MEKHNIADLVHLKCEERNHYYICLMCQRCWLLCTSYSEYKTTRACGDLKHGAPPGFYLFNSESSYVSKEYTFTKYNNFLRV